MSAKSWTPIGVLSLLAWSHSFGAGQHIERNVAKWWSYDITFDSGHVLLKVPPNHQRAADPRSETILLGSSPLKLIFSAQYDYGPIRWAKIAQFDVLYTVLKLVDPVPAESSLDEQRATFFRSLRVAQNFRNETEDWNYESTTVGGRAWLHFFDAAQDRSESYVLRCAKGYALIVTPTYKGDKLTRNAAWRKDRQQLFKQMLENVQCIDWSK